MDSQAASQASKLETQTCRVPDSGSLRRVNGGVLSIDRPFCPPRRSLPTWYRRRRAVALVAGLLGGVFCLAISSCRGSPVRLADGELEIFESADEVELDLPIGDPDAMAWTCRRLLARNDVVVNQRLAMALAEAADGDARSIIRGLGAIGGHLPSVFAPVLIARLDLAGEDVDDEVIPQILGRSLDEVTVTGVIAIARSDSVGWRRRQAIATLGYYRNRAAADALIGLLDDEESEAIQQLAMSGLERLSLNPSPGRSPVAWQRWYQQRRHLTPMPWLAQLLGDVAHRERIAGQTRREEDQTQLAETLAKFDAMARQLSAARLAVIDARRRLYRASPEPERQDHLNAWLGEEQDSLRQLAIELAEQRLTANRPFDEPLRAALRLRLGDPRTELRQRATMLLWNLADQAAADIVADRLAGSQEEDVAVRRALLMLMARLPRAAAVEPSLPMLDDATLRGPAAGALAAAIQAELAEPSQIARAAQGVRAALNDDQLPLPPIVALLACIAGEGDWKRIAGWLDASDERVKEAAARAWAASDRSLWELARRAGDVSVRQIVIAAARRRGKDGRAMVALAVQKPGDDQVLVTWRRALVEMANRVPVASILEVDKNLATQGEDELRIQLLTAGINRLMKPLAAKSSSEADDASQPNPLLNRAEPRARIVVALLLNRAEVRMDLGDPQSARADLQQIEKFGGVAKDPEFGLRFELGMLRAHLAVGDGDEADEKARGILANVSSAKRPQIIQAVANHFVESVHRHLASQQFDQARLVSSRMKALIGEPSDGLRQQMAELNQQIQIASPPEPVDASLPESAPSSQESGQQAESGT